MKDQWQEMTPHHLLTHHQGGDPASGLNHLHGPVVKYKPPQKQQNLVITECQVMQLTQKLFAYM